MKKILIWNGQFAQMLEPGGTCAGFAVQLNLWARKFAEKWNVNSVAPDPKALKKQDYCTFWKDRGFRMQWGWLYFFTSLSLIRRVKPDLIMTRGANNRNLLFISWWARLLGIKIVQFFGTDVEVDGKSGSLQDKINSSLFLRGMRHVPYFVVQNEHQRARAHARFPKAKTLLIPNVWGGAKADKDLSKRDIILWVANLRRLKRPGMLVEIAKMMPDKHFVMIGGANDKKLYDETVSRVAGVKNVEYLGAKSFDETSRYFDKAKYLLCTSEYEGFPNTFLQAWAGGVPVLSTVDPSGVIKKNNLGRECESVTDFVDAIRDLDNAPDKYRACVDDITRYFATAHSVDNHYDRLMEFLGEKEQ